MAGPPDSGPWQPRYGLGRLWLPPLTLVFRQWGWLPPGTTDSGTLSQPSPCSSLGLSASSVGGGGTVGAVGGGGPSGCGGVRDKGVKSLTSAPLQPLSKWHRPSRRSTVGRISHPLQAPRGADVSVCPGGLPSALCILVAHLALGSATRHRAGVWRGASRVLNFIPSFSRLGSNALGDCTALGLAKGLPRHLRVLQ